MSLSELPWRSGCSYFSNYAMLFLRSVKSSRNLIQAGRSPAVMKRDVSEYVLDTMLCCDY